MSRCYPAEVFTRLSAWGSFQVPPQYLESCTVPVSKELVGILSSIPLAESRVVGVVSLPLARDRLRLAEGGVQVRGFPHVL